MSQCMNSILKNTLMNQNLSILHHRNTQTNNF